MFRASLFVASGVFGTMHAMSMGDKNAKAIAPPPSIFDTNEYKPFKLISSQYETHDTRRFQFSTGNPDASANLPIASCIVLKYRDKNGNDVVRSYTPTSTNACKGKFELIVKKYPKSKMGTHLFSMQEGEELLMMGPVVKFEYTPNQFKHIGMIGGGSGITPLYQIIRGVLDNPKDKTHISLVYANNARQDIILNNELSQLCSTHSNFNAYFTLLEVPKRWLGGVGFVNKEVIEAFMPKPNEKKSKIFVCGPPPMIKAIAGIDDFSGLLAEIGYSEDQVYKF